MTRENDNFTFARVNFKMDMHDVRCIDQLYDAIIRYCEVCFMQMYDYNMGFSCRGEKLLICMDGNNIIFTPAKGSDVSCTIGASCVCNIYIPKTKNLFDYYEEGYVSAVLESLFLILGEYF